MKAGKIDYKLVQGESGAVLLTGTDGEVDKTLLIFQTDGTTVKLKCAELDGLETDAEGRIIIE